MAQLNQTELTLDFHMRSRTKVYFKGTIHSVTAYNDKGELDVLPMHTNFVSIVKKYIVLDKGLKTEQKFEFDSGVMSVQDGKIDLYVGV